MAVGVSVRLLGCLHGRRRDPSGLQLVTEGKRTYGMGNSAGVADPLTAGNLLVDCPMRSDRRREVETMSWLLFAATVWTACGVGSLIVYLRTWVDTPPLWYWPVIVFLIWPLVWTGGIIHPLR